MKYHFKVHKEKTGYWAECIELQGCISEGDTLGELKENLADALNLYLDEPVTSEIAIPLPDISIKKGKNLIEIPVDPEIAFLVSLRYYRKMKHLSQKDMMKLLGMKNVFSYQRLEKKTDPKLSTLMKIKKIIPEISIDYILQQ